ncbi:MAG: hypothetical protein D6801_03455 [Alphaproteobacteria bacterium]|nr:MAG: hypothetical protein D6801_03455 [Alphaproteobacteria bacterium]
MGFLRLLVFGFLGLSVVYVAVSLYARSVHREKLENLWAEEHPGDEDSPEREAFLEEEMRAYRHSLRYRLLLLVYILPALAGAALFFSIN